jgi:hypothetical protein
MIILPYPQVKGCATSVPGLRICAKACEESVEVHVRMKLIDKHWALNLYLI